MQDIQVSGVSVINDAHDTQDKDVTHDVTPSHLKASPHDIVHVKMVSSVRVMLPVRIVLDNGSSYNIG